MTQVTITTTGDTIDTVTTEFHLPGAGDGAVLLEWAAALHGEPVVTGQDEDGNDITRAATPDDIIRRVWSPAIHSYVEQARRWKSLQLKAAVADLPTIIVLDGPVA